MINIQFKDCCKECPNLYVLTETETTESVVSEGPIEVKANTYAKNTMNMRGTDKMNLIFASLVYAFLFYFSAKSFVDVEKNPLIALSSLCFGAAFVFCIIFGIAKIMGA